MTEQHGENTSDGNDSTEQDAKAQQIMEQIVLASIDPPAKYLLTENMTPFFEDPVKRFFDASLPQSEREVAALEMVKIVTSKLSYSDDPAKDLQKLFGQIKEAAGYKDEEKEE